MDFEYCEQCGKRVSKDDINAGAGTYKGVHFYCSGCAPKTQQSRPAPNRMDSREPRRSNAFAPPEPTRSARETRAPRESAPARGRSSRNDGYDDGYDDDYGRAGRSSARGASRRDERQSAPASRSRDQQRNGRDDRYSRDDDDDKKKKMMMYAGIAGGVLLIVVILAFAGVFSSKKPEATPSPSATTSSTNPPYGDAVAKADALLKEAIALYDKSEKKADKIKKALDKLQEGMNLLYAVLDQYDEKNLKHPKPVEDLITKMQSLNEGWKKSMPLNVY